MLGMFWNSIVDHIPLWGWFVIFGVPAGVLLYYFGPILYPIWRMLPTPVKGILIAIGVGLLAFLGGRYKGRANAEEEERRRNAEAMRKRNEVDNAIDNKSPSQVQDQLRDRWSRSDDK